jgi:hypothetical protein
MISLTSFDLGIVMDIVCVNRFSVYELNKIQKKNKFVAQDFLMNRWSFVAINKIKVYFSKIILQSRTYST